jgi:hypothetical protein
VHVFARAVLEDEVGVLLGDVLEHAAREVGAAGVAASTSAAARLNVLCPEMKPGNAGVTNVRRW